MSADTTPAFDLVDTYVTIQPDGDARTVVVDESFWPDIESGRRTDLNHGWMVGAFDYTADWGHWEMHPAGDEIVVLLDGAVDLVIDDGESDGERTVALAAGRTVVVPRGAWHRAVVHAPSRALHVTLGRGTQHRPL